MFRTCYGHSLLTILELAELENSRGAMVIADEGTIREYYDLRQKIDTYTSDMRAVITHPSYCVSFLKPGRLVHIKYQDHDFGWSVVVNCQMRRPPKNAPREEYPPHESYIVDVLLPVSEDSFLKTKGVQPLPPGVKAAKKGESSKMEVVPVLLNCIHAISMVKIKIPSNLKPEDSRKDVKKQIAQIQTRFPDGMALLDPIENMNITDDSFKRLLRVCSVLPPH